jgi:hypothetical protein
MIYCGNITCFLKKILEVFQSFYREEFYDPFSMTSGVAGDHHQQQQASASLIAGDDDGRG